MMIVTVDVEAVFSWIGTAVCVVLPLLVMLVLYANFGVHRKGGEGDKWKQ